VRPSTSRRSGIWEPTNTSSGPRAIAKAGQVIRSRNDQGEHMGIEDKLKTALIDHKKQAEEAIENLHET
jgi:hypothetical protein